MQKILITAGGTGGHIFPALVVADLLCSQGVEVRWLGAKTGLEQKLVKDKFHLYSLDIKALRGGGLLRKLTALLRLFKSIIQALFILRAYRPDALLAMGGYASAPGVIAAWILRIPIIIHEQNARAGITNKYLSKLATKVLAGFKGAFADDRCCVVGNPVRKNIITLPDKVFDDSRSLHILIIGGSQGAKFFNDSLPSMFAEISQQRDIIVKHQVGVRQLDQVRADYSGQNAEVFEFISDVAAAYAWADVVIARAGASTVAELAACGMPAVFVPFPAAVDDHQYHNALSLRDSGAAIVSRQGGKCIDEIMAYILGLNSDKLYTASKAAKSVAIVSATEDIANVCMTFRD